MKMSDAGKENVYAGMDANGKIPSTFPPGITSWEQSRESKTHV